MNPPRVPVSDEDGLRSGADPSLSTAPVEDEAARGGEEAGAVGGRAAEAERREGAAEPAAGEPARPAAGEAALRDQLLRLAAEFDNFRKRETRERAQAWGRARADLIEKLLPALEDLSRVAHPDAAEAPPDSPVRALLEGVDLVEKKVWQILGREGLQSLRPEGVFDPTQQEAILTQPTADPRLDGRIASVAQPGYRFGDRLVRPARVVVWKLSR